MKAILVRFEQKIFCLTQHLRFINLPHSFFYLHLNVYFHEFRVCGHRMRTNQSEKKMHVDESTVAFYGFFGLPCSMYAHTLYRQEFVIISAMETIQNSHY